MTLILGAMIAIAFMIITVREAVGITPSYITIGILFIATIGFSIMFMINVAFPIQAMTLGIVYLIIGVIFNLL
jgi:hypothetical protein